MQVKNMTLVITDPDYLSGGKSLINKSTIYGDWSCMCYKGSKEEVKKKSHEWDEKYFGFFDKYNSQTSKEGKDKVEQEYQQLKKKWLEDYCYGEFCADSGRVAVFDYDSLSENSKQWAKEHPWCACIIPDYTGNVEYVVEEDNSAHIVGDTFYTTQSGL